MGSSISLAGVLIGLMVALAGLVLVVFGWRGRRVGDHPHCRRCGFDLHAAPATSVRCPECGADLSMSRARVVGVRRRHRPALAIGVALLMLGLGATATQIARVDWLTLRPTWYALREARGTWPGDRVAAMELLVARTGRNELTASQQAGLRDAVTAMCDDKSGPCSVVAANWMFAEIATGSVPITQRDAFLRGYFANQSLKIRAVVHAGDRLPMRYEAMRPPRSFAGLGASGANTSLVATLSSADASFVLDGVGEPIPSRSRGSVSMALGNRASIGANGTFDLPPNLPAGSHELELRAVIRFQRGFDDQTTLCTVPFAAKSTFTVVTADTPTVTRRADESLRSAFEAAIRPKVIRYPNGPAMLEMRYEWSALPTSVGFDIWLAVGTDERKVGTFAAVPGTGTPPAPGGFTFGSSSGSGLPDDLTQQQGTVRVRLVPSDAAAIGTVDITEIWDGTLTFDNVPVEVRP